MMAHNNNWGMTHQNNEKHLINLTELYFRLGQLNWHVIVKTIVYYYVSFTNNHLKYLSNLT